MRRTATAGVLVALVGLAVAVPVASGSVTGPNGRRDQLFGDVSGDGVVDRVTLNVAKRTPYLCDVLVDLGRAAGGYEPSVLRTYDLGDSDNNYLCADMGVIVDLGGDGINEVVLAFFNLSPYEDVDLVVLRDWNKVSSFRAQMFPSGIGTADFNGDGLVDIWEYTDQAEGLDTFLNTGDSRLVQGPATLCWWYDQSVYQVVDTNVDGATDLVGQTNCGGRTLNGHEVEDRAVYAVVDGVTGRVDPLVEDVYGTYGQVAVTDVDGDSDADVTLLHWAGEPGSGLEFRNDGRGRWVEYPQVEERFTTGLGGMRVVAGGTWKSDGKDLRLTSPAKGSPANSNLIVHDAVFEAPITLSVVGYASPSSSSTDNFSVVFDYVDPTNYRYVNFAEKNSSGFSGVFSVVNGAVTQVADITVTVKAGVDHVVRVEATGTVFLNDRRVATVAEGISGRVGVGTRAAGGKFDNLRVTLTSEKPLFGESFDAGVGQFAAVSGGTWSASGGSYRLTAPASSTSGNANLAVHPRVVNGDVVVEAQVSVAKTSRTDDVSIVLGYQDPANYYYVNLAEKNSGTRSGIFRVLNGTSTQLADISSTTSTARTYAIRVDRSADGIRVFRDGALMAFVYDSTFVAGKIGFGTGGGSAVVETVGINTRF